MVPGTRDSNHSDWFIIGCQVPLACLTDGHQLEWLFQMTKCIIRYCVVQTCSGDTNSSAIWTLFVPLQRSVSVLQDGNCPNAGGLNLCSVPAHASSWSVCYSFFNSCLVNATSDNVTTKAQLQREWETSIVLGHVLNTYCISYCIHTFIHVCLSSRKPGDSWSLHGCAEVTHLKEFYSSA